MAIVSKETLKTYFLNSKVPGYEEYVDFIDTMGDMNRSIYDTNLNGKVDDAEAADLADNSLQLGGVAASSYLQRVSAARPGVTKLYRIDSDSGYYVRHYWTGTHWYLQGYNSSDVFHAGCRVEYANVAPWTGISGKPSTYPPSSHTHGGGDITSAVANADYAANSNLLDNLNSTQFLRSDANETLTGYLDSSNYMDAALGFRINGTQLGNIILYNAADFLGHADWDFGDVKNVGSYTLTRAMFGYPSAARYLYCKWVAKGTTSTLGYGGLNNDGQYSFHIGSTHDNTFEARDTGWVKLASTGGNFYARVGTTSAYVLVKVMGYSL